VRFSPFSNVDTPSHLWRCKARANAPDPASNLAALRPVEVLLVNARHVKNVPGRKSDALDAVWLAELTECGLLWGSVIPPAQIAAIRELTRYRKKLIEARTSELQRLAKALEDSGIKIDSVASKLTTPSARDMIEALIAGNAIPPCWRIWLVG
jgi:transposase